MTIHNVKDGSIVRFEHSITPFMKVCSACGIGAFVDITNGIYYNKQEISNDYGEAVYMLADSIFEYMYKES